MISVNQVWDFYKSKVKEYLESDSGCQLYAQRKIEVEPVFGQMKHNFGVRRVHVSGKIGVSNDIGILLMAMNLTRLAEMIRRKGRGSLVICIFS
ncbi:transposase [Globicatella sanguinis]|uniref:transposase n=1 Tax=Globicatella sanguinis TaxID=13076 RepID=UPI0034E84FF3